MLSITDVPMPQQERMRVLEILLMSYGYVNRDTLCQIWGLTESAVSGVVSEYKKHWAGEKVFYNRASKRIEKTSDLEPIFKV